MLNLYRKWLFPRPRPRLDAERGRGVGDAIEKSLGHSHKNLQRVSSGRTSDYPVVCSPLFLVAPPPVKGKTTRGCGPVPPGPERPVAERPDHNSAAPSQCKAH